MSLATRFCRDDADWRISASCCITALCLSTRLSTAVLCIDITYMWGWQAGSKPVRREWALEGKGGEGGGQRGRDTQGRTQESDWICQVEDVQGLSSRGRFGEAWGGGRGGKGRVGSHRDSKQSSRIIVSTVWFWVDGQARCQTA